MFYNGAATNYYARSPKNDVTDKVTGIGNIMYSMGMYGIGTNSPCTDLDGILPAVILPTNAVFDQNTMLLKGVA